MALSDEQTFLLNSSETTLPVDSEATERFVDDDLIPDLKVKMLNYAVLRSPTKSANGKQILLGTAT